MNDTNQVVWESDHFNTYRLEKVQDIGALRTVISRFSCFWLGLTNRRRRWATEIPESIPQLPSAGRRSATVAAKSLRGTSRSYSPSPAPSGRGGEEAPLHCQLWGAASSLAGLLSPAHVFAFDPLLLNSPLTAQLEVTLCPVHLTA